MTARQAISRRRLDGQGSAAAVGNAAVGGGLARHGGPAAGLDELPLPVAVGDGLEFGQFCRGVRCEALRRSPNRRDLQPAAQLVDDVPRLQG